MAAVTLFFVESQKKKFRKIIVSASPVEPLSLIVWHPREIPRACRRNRNPSSLPQPLTRLTNGFAAWTWAAPPQTYPAQKLRLRQQGIRNDARRRNHPVGRNTLL